VVRVTASQINGEGATESLVVRECAQSVHFDQRARRTSVSQRAVDCGLSPAGNKRKLVPDRLALTLTLEEYVSSQPQRRQMS
jgi:hypothetical protein